MEAMIMCQVSLLDENLHHKIRAQTAAAYECMMTGNVHIGTVTSCRQAQVRRLDKDSIYDLLTRTQYAFEATDDEGVCIYEQWQDNMQRWLHRLIKDVKQ